VKANKVKYTKTLKDQQNTDKVQQIKETVKYPSNIKSQSPKSIWDVYKSSTQK